MFDDQENDINETENPNAEGQASNSDDTGANAPQIADQSTSETMAGDTVTGAGDPSTEAKPQPHEDGGATLVQAASAQPILVATIEVYKGAKGTFHTNLFTPDGSHPQHSSDDPAQTREAVNEFLTIKLG